MGDDNLCGYCNQPKRTIEDGVNAGMRYCPGCKVPEGSIVVDEHTPYCLRGRR